MGIHIKIENFHVQSERPRQPAKLGSLTRF